MIIFHIKVEKQKPRINLIFYAVQTHNNVTALNVYQKNLRISVATWSLPAENVTILAMHKSYMPGFDCITGIVLVFANVWKVKNDKFTVAVHQIICIQ